MSESPEDRRRRRTTVAGALFLAVMLALGLWLADVIAERQKLEKCLNSGRRDCGAIPAGQGALPGESGRVYTPPR